jgi:hypothetical protein
MAQLTASRTLVKSNPELWAECSDATSLARHLGAFGEIHITKLEPETAVAWEGEDTRGTVTLEPSGWGTRVVLTAELPTSAVGVEEPAGDQAATPEAGSELEPLARREPVSAGVSDPLAAVEPDPVCAQPDPMAADAPESGAAAGPGLGAADRPESQSAQPPRAGLLRRLFGGWRRSADPVPDPVAEPAEVLPVRARIRPPIAPVAFESAAPVESVGCAASVAPVAPAAPAGPDSPSAEALVGALDSLGRAHRRPFSHG